MYIYFYHQLCISSFAVKNKEKIIKKNEQQRCERDERCPSADENKQKRIIIILREYREQTLRGIIEII